MAISYSRTTGWSGTIRYNISDGDPYSDNSYNDPLNATWFQRSWWTTYRWARKYVNLFEVPVRMTKMSFLACPGHSNGRQYNGGGGLVGPSSGYGCTFTVDLYVNGEGGVKNSVTAAATHTLNSINQYNCYYGGYGLTSTSDQNTSFGSVAFYGPGTGRDVDSNGHKKYRYANEFVFDDAPAIPPGHAMYVHVRPTGWASGSNTSNSLLVVQSQDPFFEAELEPAEQPYIWRFDGTKWVKDRYAFQFSNGKWNKLSDDGT